VNKTYGAQAADWREGRRLQAWGVVPTGVGASVIAGALGVTPGAVCQWMKRQALARRFVLHA